MKLPTTLLLIAIAAAAFALDWNDAFASSHVQGVSGIVFVDNNGDGQFTPEEYDSLVSGATVLWVDMSDWSKVGRVVTEDAGTYIFILPAGDYLVQLEGVAAEEVLTGHAYLTVSAGMTTVQDFTLRPSPPQPLPPPPEPQAAIAQIFEMISDLKKMISGLEDRITPLESLTPLDCPAGQVPIDGTCMDVICPTGYGLQGNQCEVIHCKTGYGLNHTTNVCEFAGCPGGFELTGNECTEIECPEGLVINDDTNACEDRPHIKTDKDTYGLGDVIKASGKVEIPEPAPARVDGTQPEHIREMIRWQMWGHVYTIPEHTCENPGYEYVLDEDGNHVYDENGRIRVDLDGWYEANPNLIKDYRYPDWNIPCTIDFDESTGQISFEVPVEGSWAVNQHYYFLIDYAVWYDTHYADSHIGGNHFALE